MIDSRTQGQDDIQQMLNRLDWMDEERLKTSRRLVQLEQRLATWEKNLESREKRVQELEGKITGIMGQVAQISRVDAQLELFKDEMVKLIEQYDTRRIEGYEELDKLRRVEHEVQQREVAEIKKELAPISRYDNELKLLHSEDARLTSIVGRLQNNISAIKNDNEMSKQEIKFIEEAARSNSESIGNIQTTLLERIKRIESLETRLDITNHSLTKLQVTSQELKDSVHGLSLRVKEWSDQVQIGEHQRNKRLEGWQLVLDDFKDQIERYATEWVKYSDQYKESKMAVQALVEWQERIEIQQKENAELTRVETNQMRSKWDSFLLENEKRWKNYESERDQRWAGAQRRETAIKENLQTISELLEQLQQEKDALWRVQAAQTDAMKKMPRIWLEEVEKAKAHNPNSRRQPALVPVREE